MQAIDRDWYFVKAAAILRRIYLNTTKNLGIQTLKVALGGRQSRGAQPNTHAKHAGKVIRNIVQQLRENKLVEMYYDAEKVPKGLVITKHGRKYLDTLANRLAKSQK